MHAYLSSNLSRGLFVGSSLVFCEDDGTAELLFWLFCEDWNVIKIRTISPFYLQMTNQIFILNKTTCTTPNPRVRLFCVLSAAPPLLAGVLILVSFRTVLPGLSRTVFEWLWVFMQKVFLRLLPLKVLRWGAGTSVGHTNKGRAAAFK